MSKPEDAQSRNDSTKPMRIGFIGLGEVGRTFSHGLKANGALVLAAYDFHYDLDEQGEMIHATARELQINLASSITEVVETSDMILSCVTPSSALSVIQQISADLKHNHIFLDLNSISPQKKKAAASLIAKSGAQMIDGAIMGSVLALGFEVPILVSGPKAHEISKILRTYGMNVDEIEGPVGTAATIKMLRSLFMKGLEALLVETADAAKACGEEQAVMQNICSTLDERPFADTAKYLLESNLIHAARRANELDDVLEMLKEVDINSAMTIAAKEVISRSTRLSR